jgi:hypothetical protein
LVAAFTLVIFAGLHFGGQPLHSADPPTDGSSVLISSGVSTNEVLEGAPAASSTTPVTIPASISTTSPPPMPAPQSNPKSDPAPYNRLILDAIAQMPKGGGYSTGKDATRNLLQAVSLAEAGDPPNLKIAPQGAQPSFCSEATYLVLLQVYSQLVAERRLALSRADLENFLVHGQADGEGIWGRWNANGPGTARLFYELKLGENFDDLARAQPGDFMKVFWNDEIGFKEKGHSVIFLGRKETPTGPAIHIWSSNLDGGYGEKDVPLSSIHRFLFSRLLKPAAVKDAALPHKDEYLAGLLKVASTPDEMYAMTGTSSTTSVKTALRLTRPPELRSDVPASPEPDAKYAPVPGTKRAQQAFPTADGAASK